jgi:hypothetical protein
MTFLARNVQRSLVDIIRPVAGITIRRCGLQFRNGVGGGVTGITGDKVMLTDKREGVDIMVEKMTVGINTVMACQAISAESLHMRGHKTGIQLFVTGQAYGWIERTKVRAMAIGTGEGLTAGGNFMSN